MAGQHVVPVEQIPKGQAIIITRTLEAAQLTAGAGNQSHPLFLNNTGKRLVIQKASGRCNVANGDPFGPIIARRANGSGTAIPVTAASGPAFTTANTSADFTLWTSDGVPSANIVEPGELVSLDHTVDGVEIDRLNVTLVLTETVY